MTEQQIEREERGQKLRLFCYFVGALALQAFFSLIPGGNKLNEFFAEVFANWESEFLQLYTQKRYESKSTGAQIKAIRSELREIKELLKRGQGDG